MTNKEKKQFRENFDLTVAAFNMLVKMIADMSTAQKKLGQFCRKFKNWVDAGKKRKEAAIELLVLQGMSRTVATGRIEAFLEWANDAYSEEFFGLPAGVRHRYRKFSPENMNVVMENPDVILVVLDQQKGTYAPTHVHYTDLTAKEIRQAFTDTGVPRSEAEQEARMKRADTTTTGTVVNSTINIEKGVYGVEFFIDKALMIVTIETDECKSKRYVKKFEDALETARKQLEKIQKDLSK